MNQTERLNEVGEALGTVTDDDLDAIRRKFLGKAFERRQELLRKVAGVRRNAEFNGTICRSLLAERKAELHEVR